MDLWSSSSLKSNQNCQDQKSLSLPRVIFGSFLSVPSLTLHFLQLHISWIASFIGLSLEFVALLLLRAATFSDARKRRNGTHGLKAAKENQRRDKCWKINIVTWRLQILFHVYCSLIEWEVEGTHRCSSWLHYKVPSQEDALTLPLQYEGTIWWKQVNFQPITIVSKDCIDKGHAGNWYLSKIGNQRQK